MELLAALNAAGFLMAILAHRFLFPPPREKCPTRTALLGSLTFLTVQSNLICYYYNFMRLLAPDGEVVRLLYPLAFSLGVMLTLLYYSLDHFVNAKQAEDRLWIKKGWTWIPIANHLEHAPALPLALLDAFGAAHGATTDAEIYVVCGGYIGFYLVVTLLQKRIHGAWVYPVYDEAVAAAGPIGFWLIAVPVVGVCLGLGFVARRVGAT